MIKQEDLEFMDGPALVRTYLGITGKKQYQLADEIKIQPNTMSSLLNGANSHVGEVLFWGVRHAIVNELRKRDDNEQLKRFAATGQSRKDPGRTPD